MQGKGRPLLANMLTNQTIFGPAGWPANGFADFSSRMSVPLQITTSVSNGSRFANSAQFGLTNPLPHHESSGGADIHQIEVAQLICEETRAKRPMSPDIDSPQENDQRHDTPYFSESELNPIIVADSHRDDWPRRSARIQAAPAIAMVSAVSLQLV